MNEEKISGTLTVTGTINGTITIGGGSTPVLEEVTVRSNPDEQQIITPPEGVDGFSKITVRKRPLTNKTIQPSTTEQTYSAWDEDSYGYKTVTVGAMNLQTKTVTPSSVQQVITPDAGWDGMSSVTVGAVNLQSKSVNPSIYFPRVVNPDTGFDGLSSVTVSKVELQSKSVTPSSVQQTIEPDSGYIGLSQVTVGASEDNLDKILNNSDSSVTPVSVTVNQTGSTCYGFFGKYDLTITGGNSNFNSIGRNAFTYQKYLRSIVADNIKYMSNGDELSYSGLVTGHFANLIDFTNSTFRGCKSITDLYFGYEGVISGMLMSGRIFDGRSSGTVNIHVKASQLSAYQADSTWQGIVSAEANAGVTVNIVGDYA